MILWDLDSGSELHRFVRVDPTPEKGSTGIAFMPDGQHAISCEQDGALILWDVKTGAELSRIGRHPSLRTRLVVSSDGRYAMTSGMDGGLMLWDVERRELIRRTEGHSVIFDLALSPDGKSVLFGGTDGSLVEWQFGAPTTKELQEWIAHHRYVQ